MYGGLAFPAFRVSKIKLSTFRSDNSARNFPTLENQAASQVEMRRCVRVLLLLGRVLAHIADHEPLIAQNVASWQQLRCYCRRLPPADVPICATKKRPARKWKKIMEICRNVCQIVFPETWNFRNRTNYSSLNSLFHSLP